MAHSDYPGPPEEAGVTRWAARAGDTSAERETS